MSSTTPSGQRPDRLTIGALVASLIVGPVGAILGFVAYRKTQPPASRTLPLVAVGLGIVQTVVGVGFLTNGFAAPGAAPTASGVPSVIVVAGATVTPEFTPRTQPTYVVPTGTPTETSTTAPPPLAPSSVGPYGADTVRPDPTQASKGAQSAEEGTYTNGQATIQLRQSDWPSPAAALAAAEDARKEFANMRFLKSGTVGNPPSGQYWIYDDNGNSAIVWTKGSRLGIATGPATDIQFFFVQVTS